MNRSSALFLGTLAIVLGALAWFWLPQPVSNQELLASYAKAQDFWEGAREVGGLPWWTPYFLQGTTLATAWGNALSSLLLLAGAGLLGPFAGSKATALFCVLVGGTGMYVFVRKLVGDGWSGLACGLAYALCPPLLVRLFGYEHFVVVCAMAFIPWAFLGTLSLVRRPSLLSALGAAAGLAAVVLAYAKNALLCLPVLGLFGLVLYLGQSGDRRPTWKALLLAAGLLAGLALLPNLPGLRESRSMVMFEFSPYTQWQSAFSTKSALSWLDRDGLASEGMAPQFAPTTSKGGNYPGVVVFAALVGVYFFRRDLLALGAHGQAIRLFTALALFLHWLSFGPRSVLGGHLEFLRLAAEAHHWTVAAAWFSLVVQVWLISRLFPPTLPARGWAAGILAAVYLVVPGFRLIEWLPGFDTLRAPQDFYQIPGAFCVAVAGGLALRQLLGLLPRAAWMAAAGAGCLLLTLADVYPYWKPALKGPLSQDVFTQFQEAQDFLRQTPKTGWVYPLSGRYFYLLTPSLSGRPLAAEAFNSYLQQRGVAMLQGAASSSPKLLEGYLYAGGVSHVLIDKNDPDTPKEMQDQYAADTTLVFENDHFAIRETRSPGPVYLARDFLHTATDGPFATVTSLSYATFNLATITLTGAAMDLPGLRGKILADKVDFLAGKSSEDAHPFAALPAQPAAFSYQTFSAGPANEAGWIIAGQAFHPDWKASAAGNPLPVVPAYGGLLAVKADPGTRVDFQFEPPWWYSPCIYASLAFWMLAGLTAGASRLPFLPASVSAALHKPLSQGGTASPLVQDDSPVTRPLVAIPTYCEAELINTVLDRVLAAAPEIQVLVIDDASPDGTGSVVENRPDFGHRTHLLRRKGKLGLGSAYKEAFQWALERNYDAVLEMDADLSHPPEDVPKLIAALNEGHDAAIGSRYLGGVRVINWPQHRLLLSAWASGYVRWLTGMPLTDATSGFKAIRSALLRDMNWSQFRAEGYGFQVELHYFLWRRGARLIEVPIVFTERLGGKTKMNPGIAAEAALRVLQLSLQRPFHHP